MSKRAAGAIRSRANAARSILSRSILTRQMSPHQISIVSMTSGSTIFAPGTSMSAADCASSGNVR